VHRDPARPRPLRPPLAALLLSVALTVWPLRLPTTGVQAYSRQATACTDVVGADRTLAQDLTNLAPAGAAGTPELCLLNDATDDIYKAIVIGVDDAPTFDEAKAMAEAQLPALGVDLRRIGSWTAQGAAPIQLTLDEQENLPVEHTPRLQAADAGANALLPAVRDAFARMIDVTDAQTGWRPIRPFTVKVFTDVTGAIPVFQEYMLPTLTGETPDSLAQRTRRGDSWHKPADPTYGNLILLNLTNAGGRTTGTIAWRTAFMYTSYANTGLLGGGFADYWFRQGLDSFQAERNGGSASGFLAVAARAQQDGSETTPLSDLTTLARWLAHQRGEGETPVQARGHAAIVYLQERYGFDLLIQLLPQNHNGDQPGFESLLANLTGMDLNGLDQAFSTWLSGATTNRVSGAAGFHVDVTVSPAQSYAEFAVTFDRAVPCGGGRQVTAGTTATFWAPVPPSGVVTAMGYVGDATVTVQATVAGGSAGDTVQFKNATTGCDTGPLPFGG
jgi:hypothetical protein